MPAKKKNKSDKKGSAKKKKGAEDGFNAAVCKKFLKHYQQKCEAVGALPYRSLVQDIAEGVEQDKLIEKVSTRVLSERHMIISHLGICAFGL